MDEQTLRQRIQQARDEGYNDEEIQAVLQKMGNVSMPAEAPKKSEEPIVPVIPPQQLEQFNREQEAINERVSEKGMTTSTALGLGAAAVGGPILLYKGARAVLSPAARASSELAQRGVQAAENIGKTMAQTESRVGANQAAKAAQQAASRPVAPTQLLDQFGRPIQAPTTGPVAPPTQQPSMMSQVQRMAFDKLKQLGPGMARAATGLGALTYSSDLGPKVPTKGAYRGMEINPRTGRPFTEEELAILNR